MSLKFALIATAVWTFAAVALGGFAIWYIMAHPLPGAAPEDRAAQLGRGMGLLTGIGYAVIWIPFAASLGQQRRAALKAKSKNGSL